MIIIFTNKCRKVLTVRIGGQRMQKAGQKVSVLQSVMLYADIEKYLCLLNTFQIPQFTIAYWCGCGISTVKVIK